MIMGDPNLAAIAADRAELSNHVGEIVATLRVSAERRGIENQDAKTLAVYQARDLLQLLHGSTYTYPSAKHIECHLRNVTIWAEYDGTWRGPNGINALARRYRLTTRRIRQILRDERQRQQAVSVR